jgi:hypothetical protein
MRRKILPFILGGALSVAAIAPAAANHTAQHQLAGAGGLVAAVVQAQVRDVNVFVLNNSLNNLLRAADIDVDILNDSEILSRFNIDIEEIHILSDGSIQVVVLGGPVITFVPPGA